MSQIKFFAVASLPGSLEADSFYYVENGSYAESYLTDKTGTAKMVGNSSMINALIAAELAIWTGASSQVTIAADMSARDALASTAETNLMVLVIDATADPTVGTGSALYAYDLASTTWFKIAEYESMDIAIAWSDISDGPNSSVAQIDDAVTKAHAHTNKAVLDKLSEDGGALLFDGDPLSTTWTTKNW